MNKEIPILLPKLGESILSATVVLWLKKPGEKIAKDEAILEVSTDKVNSEIPSPVEGVLKEILVQVDEDVEVGAPLAIVSLAEAGSEVVHIDKEPVKAKEELKLSSSQNQNMHGFYSPSVMQLAQEKGIAFAELEKIKGTGNEGRITKKDIELHVAHKSHAKKEARPCPKERDFVENNGVDHKRVKITGLRKAIADTMMRSYQEIPHASLLAEVDVTELLALIHLEREKFYKEHGIKLTLTSFVAKAIAEAAVQYPLLNGSVEEDEIIVKHSVNIGIAVGVEQGVIVPVIKSCEKKCIGSIAKEIAQLAEKTRTSKLQHEDVTEGTITLTNFGMTGAKLGFPIIRHPEVAIIGTGAVQKRVVVVEGDAIAIRSMMDLTFCFDHRVVDGIYGCNFLNAIKQYLQQPTL